MERAELERAALDAVTTIGTYCRATHHCRDCAIQDAIKCWSGDECGLPKEWDIKQEAFYFTFGTNPGFPFQRGWVEVWAKDIEEAIEKFRAKYPDRTPGVVNCAFFYDSKRWAEMNPEFNPVWEGSRTCWDIIT